MNCSEFEEALAEAFGGGTAEPASPDALAHLRECAACRGRARQVLRLHESLHRALTPYPKDFDDAMKKVLSGVDQDLRSQSSEFAAAARSKIRTRRLVPLFAAGFLVAAVTLAIVLLSRPAGIDTAKNVVPPSAVPEVPKVPEPSNPGREGEEEAARRNEERRRVEERRARIERERQDLLDAASKKPEDPAIRRKLEELKAEEKAIERAPDREKAPEPPAPKGPPPSTVAAVARLGSVKGTVFILAPASEKTPARGGLDLAAGQSVVTEGAGSAASVVENAVQIRLGADSNVLFSAAEASIAEGRVDIEAQGPLVVKTGQARIEIAPGHFLLHARPDSTYFESLQGSAKFNAAVIPAGQFAVAGTRGPDQARIDKAIKDGVEFLKKAPSPPYTAAGIANSDALILLTFVHAGVPENDPRFQELLQNLLKAPLDRTYPVALQAMVLEELDRVKYQPRIADCARFLVDNQCRNGQWTYGTPTPATGGGFVDPRPDVATAVKLDEKGRRIKPKIAKKIAVQKTRDGPAEGDNSNAQYAALGLRACSDAGIVVPPEVLHLAAKWWRDCQYADKDDRKNAYNGKGWCYHDGKGKVNGSDCCKYTYASMTAGAVGSLVIYDHLLGKDWKSDVAVRLGLEWLTANFSVTWNYKWGKEIPGDPENQGAHFYYLYALERLGVFTGQEKMGRHEWYPEGATVLLERQRPDGSWLDVPLDNQPVWDTCFSILFLRRATRPLTDVPSIDRAQKR